MFNFLIGWGVFWLLTWFAVWTFGLYVKNGETIMTGGGGFILTVFYLIAVIVGYSV